MGYFIVLFCLILSTMAFSQVVPVDLQSVPVSDTVKPDTAALKNTDILADTAIVIPKLDFTSVSLLDALTALVRSYSLSVAIDSSVSGVLSLHLTNVRLNDALHFIVKEHQLSYERTGGITKIFRPKAVPVPPAPLAIRLEDSLLSVDLSQVPLSRFVHEVGEQSGRNLVILGGAEGMITGTLRSVPFDQALSVLLGSNGFEVRESDGVYYVSKPQAAAAALPAPGSANSITCDSGLVSVSVQSRPLSEVLSQIGRACGQSLNPIVPLEGIVTIAFAHFSFDDALVTLLWNTPYTFRPHNGIYAIGSKESEDLFDTKLVKLKHLIANTLNDKIPATLTKGLTIKVIPEHNGFLLTGARTSIAKVESFLKEVDVPPAQVLFEVLVVDYTTTDRAEFSIKANNYSQDDNKKDFYPGLDLAAEGHDLNDDLNSLSRHLGISNLGKLPDNFYVRLQWLQQQGKANIRSHPRIAALNGHAASIKIGTTQYFLLQSNTIYPSQQTSVTTQTSQRFEKIDADMSLEVIPFVNDNGELTVEIKPEFNTPAEAFNPDVPPTINRRVLNSTVRLRNGETIVLGGLVQTSKSATIQKFPILGSLPFIGRIFQNRSSTNINSELTIYLTPYVYYDSDSTVNLKEIQKR